jgi:hypothetical protein
MSARVRDHIRSNVIGYIALFFALGGGAAWATHPGGANTISSGDIQDNQVFSADVRNDTLTGGGLAAADLRPGSVGTSEVALNSLNGGDINESSLGIVPNADRLDGIDSSGFVQTSDWAGGDLYGEFSNLQIGGGAVGTSELSSSIPAVRVTRNSNQTISNNTWTALAFDTEHYDTAAMHDNTTNNNRLTAPVTGIYLITAHLDWAYQQQGTRELSVWSGTTIANSGPYFGPGPEEITTQARLTAGQSVELHVYQNGGGNLDVLGNVPYDRLEFSMTWVAPGP